MAYGHDRPMSEDQVTTARDSLLSVIVKYNVHVMVSPAVQHPYQLVAPCVTTPARSRAFYCLPYFKRALLTLGEHYATEATNSNGWSLSALADQRFSPSGHAMTRKKLRH